MQTHLLTLMPVMAINLFVMATLLPWLMGQRVSSAARSIQIALLLQAVGTSALVTDANEWAFLLSSMGIACYAGSLWAILYTLTQWLGPRPYSNPLMVLVSLTPAGYALLFEHEAWRLAWVCSLLAAMMLIVARATLYPVAGTSSRWRFLLCGCLIATSIATLMRGFLSAFIPTYILIINVIVVTNISLLMGTIALLVAWRAEAEKKLRSLVITDSLTKLINRRGFSAQGRHMLIHAHRHHIPLAAIMMDLDHFKNINDTLGHAAGDKALTFFARHLQATCRSGDLVARLGGEEFGALLLHNSPTAGAAFDKRLRKRLTQYSLSELGYQLNFSAGMALLAPNEGSLSALMARADAAMYQAKTTGRGRMVIVIKKTSSADAPISVQPADIDPLFP